MEILPALPQWATTRRLQPLLATTTFHTSIAPYYYFSPIYF
jgi:hypothetical protein